MGAGTGTDILGWKTQASVCITVADNQHGPGQGVIPVNTVHDIVRNFL